MSMSDVVIYEDGTVELSATVENETVWLSQKQMSELFDVKVPAISKHLKNIFQSGELDQKVVISKMETTTLHAVIKSKTKYLKDSTTRNLKIVHVEKYEGDI